MRNYTTQMDAARKGILTPEIKTVAQKERVMDRLLTKAPNYRKGNADEMAKIAQEYPTAVKNAKKTVLNLLQDGLPGIEDTDERNRWLCQKCFTFLMCMKQSTS